MSGAFSFFLSDGGRVDIYVHATPPTSVHFIQELLSATPPLRKGSTGGIGRTVGVAHRAIGLTPQITGFVKSALIVEQP